MNAVKYQTMPPLSPDEYAELEQSILANGVQVPIIVDDHGVVIDGHHRKAIAERHGLYLPVEKRQMLTESQKIDLSIQLNIARRQLNREQKRSIVEAALKAQPEKSNREHARQVGVSHVTVASVRDELESTGQIDQLDKTVGADGKERPASRPVQVEEISVDARTGEVLDEPVAMTHTETFKTETKTAPVEQKPREPKPVPTGDEANRQNAIQVMTNICRSLEAVQYLNYENARHGIVTDWWPIGKHDVPPEQAAYFTPAELRKLAQGFKETANLLEEHRVH